MQPFPFFGAGDARYFEFADLAVRFAKVPRGKKRTALLANVPEPFREGVTIKGRHLVACSPDYVHLPIMETYDADPGDEDELGNRFEFAASSRVRRFNEDIERWLRELHAVVPIVAVVRTEDGEAGGTDLSDWHTESIGRLDTVLADFEEHITKKRRSSPATTILAGILTFAEDAGVDLPLRFFGWQHPEALLSRAVETGDVDAAWNILEDLQPEDREQAVRALDLANSAIRATVMRLQDFLRTFEAGVGVLVTAAVLSSDDPIHDPAVTAVLAFGAPFGRSARDALVSACNCKSDRIDLRNKHVATRRYPDDAYCLIAYLGQVIRTKTFDDVDPEVVSHAETKTDQYGILENLTHIFYERHDYARGIALVDQHEAQHAIPKRALLNAALLHLGAGTLDRADDYAKQSKEAGDEGAQLVEAAIVLARGDRAGALRILKKAKKSGYRQLYAWREDRCFDALHGDAEYEAVFA